MGVRGCPRTSTAGAGPLLPDSFLPGSPGARLRVGCSGGGGSARSRPRSARRVSSPAAGRRGQAGELGVRSARRAQLVPLEKQPSTRPRARDLSGRDVGALRRALQAAPGRPWAGRSHRCRGPGLSSQRCTERSSLPQNKCATRRRRAGWAGGRGPRSFSIPMPRVTPRPGDLSVAAGTGRPKWEQRLEKAGGARPGGRAAGERVPGGAARVRAQRRPAEQPGARREAAGAGGRSTPCGAGGCWRSPWDLPCS